MTANLSAHLARHAKPCSPLAVLSANRRLDALAKAGLVDDARRLFDEMLHRDECSWNTMLAAYARTGLFPVALRLFSAHPHALSSSVPWSTLISSLARHSQPLDALRLFRRLLDTGLRPDPYALGAALRASSSAALPRAGSQLHVLALKSGFHYDSFVAAGLVDMYAKCGNLLSAAQVFDSIPIENRANRVLWTAMVTGQAQNGDAPGALDRFQRMRAVGLAPSQFTLPSVLVACAAEHALAAGRQVHACVVRAGLEASMFVCSAMVSMYASCDDLISARRVLDTAESDDSVSWNTLIVRCSRGGLQCDALSLFIEMRQRGLDADEFTFPSALNSAASSRDLETGRAVHCLILKLGLVAHQHVSNALIDMYAKCGLLGSARAVFDESPEQDVVSWTALLTGLAQHGSHDAALHVYCEMLSAGVDSDEFITAGVLSSCAELTLLELGQQVHGTSLKRRFDSFASVRNSLVSMYAKTGCIDDAHTVFDSMVRRDAITWTALIVGYAQNGRGKQAVWFYDEMVQTGIKPDYVTFIGLLFACSHAGLVDLGRTHFDSMELVYGIEPGPEHYACMVDILGRAGRVSEAVDLLSRMKARPDATVWKALLAACRVHGRVAVAEHAAGELFALDPSDPVPYVLLSNIYSAAKRWGDVARVRSLMKSRGAGKKEPGCSWVGVGGAVHAFHVEDRGHPQTAEIYRKVEEMMGRICEAGYVAETGHMLHDIGEEGKAAGLLHHSERLAVAFGLISTPEGAPIRVFKNLRVCGDCHTALKLVAKLYGRKIILRDANCFHHMSSDGVCSCGDYW